jgi:hypothetical protein
MGTIFKLIADHALQAEDPSYYSQCQVCESPGVPVYPCQGRLIREDGTTERDHDVYVACEKCLKARRIEHIDEYYLNEFIASRVDDAAVALDLMRQTPRCPNFVQDSDWPICCRQLTEYTGEPTLDEAQELDCSGQYWSQGPETFDTPVVGLVPKERLSVLGGVSAFRCQVCGKKFWIFQFT